MKKLVFLLVLLSFAAMVNADVIRGTSVDVSMAKYDPIPAGADNYVTVWFDVTNRGTENIDNFTVTLTPKYPFSLTDNDPDRMITIAGLTTSRVEYRMLVDKNAPDGKSEIEIRYLIAKDSLAKKKFNITVNNSIEKAHLDAIYVSSKPSPYAGGKTTVSIDVVNADRGIAYYIIAKASSSVATIERNEIFIGTLEPDDFDNVDFDLEINKDTAPGVYPLDVVFEYRDENSKLLTETDTIELNVKEASDVLPQQQEVPIYMYPVYLVVLLFVIRLAIPFFRWLFKPFRRKHREHKK